MSENVALTLKSKRKEIGKSVREVVQELRNFGVDISEKTLYGWESGHRQPDADVFLILCRIYGISSFAGIDDISKNKETFFSNAEVLHIEKYRRLDTRGKKAVDAVLDVEYNSVISEQKKTEEEDATPVEILQIFKFDEPVSAGTGVDLGAYEDGVMLNIISNIYTNKTDYILRVRGDSMEPKFFDGDLIMVQKTDSLDVGEIGIWIIEGKGYVKQRGEKGLISLNPKYDPIFPDDIESQRCSGRVIGVLDPAWIVKGE